MYKEIDELIDVICHDDVFKSYLQAEKSLQDEKIILLLSRHQVLQEDYLRIKNLSSYVSNDHLKEELMSLKKEMTNHVVIQNYYQRYYEMNDLLEEITALVFHGIGRDLSLDTLRL